MPRDIVKNILDGGLRISISAATLLAPISVFLTIILSHSIGIASEALGFELNSSIPEEPLSLLRLSSALVIAPVLENLLCLLWIEILSTWSSRNWWTKSLVIAIIAALFHVLILWDVRLLAVVPGFFVINVFISQSKNRFFGYVASVVHHFFINLINFAILLYFA